MRYLFCLVFFVISVTSAHAEKVIWGSACEANVISGSFPVINTKLSIDPNAPVGTIFYNRNAAFPAGTFKCSSPVRAYVKAQIASPAGTGAGQTTVPGFSGYGQVFKTNVEGVGLLYLSGNGANLNNKLPYQQSDVLINDSTYTIKTTGMSLSIVLIKYGVIPPGTHKVTLNSTIAPSVSVEAVIYGSTDVGKIPNGTIGFASLGFSSSSTITLVNSTCNAPMVPVNMGKRFISQFTTENSRLVGPWVDASINLTNCPVFYGGGSATLNNATQANTMKVTITPTNATTSNIGLMPVNTGAQAATNVGIQLGWGTAATQTLLNFSSGKASNTYAMSSTQGSTFKIPLVARYRQINAGTIGVGNANGQVTYIIDYY